MTAGMFGMPPGFGFQTINNATIIVSSSAAGTGIFIYNGSPGVGNLIGSIAAPGVTADPFANAVSPEIALYGSGNQSIVFNVGSGVATETFSTGASFEGTKALFKTGTVGSGAAQIMQLDMFGPASNVAGATDNVGIILASSNDGGTVNAQGTLVYNDSSGSAHSVLSWQKDSLGNIDVSINILSSPVFIANGTSGGSFSGGAEVFATSSHLKYEAADANSYDTGRLTQVAAGGQVVSAVSLTALTGLSAPVVAGTYHFRARLSYVSTAVGTPSFGFSGPAATSVLMAYTMYGNATAIAYTTQTALPATPVAVGGPTMVAGTKYQCNVEGTIVFSASGTFQMLGQTSVAADTWTVAYGSVLEMYPVV
jgi:hypothetical protein